MSDLINAGYPVKNPSQAAQGMPYPMVRCNYDPVPPHLLVASQALAPITTGQAFCVGISLVAGDIVNRVHYVTGSTAGATLTNSFAALYDPNGNLISQSTARENVIYAAGIPAGNTAIAALAANTNVGHTLGSNAAPTPYVVSTPGWYYVVFSITGTTMPTFSGLTLANLLDAGNVTGLAAASRVASLSSAAFQLAAGKASGVAGNYVNEPNKSQLLASTYTTTAPAALTTNGAPTALAPLPVVFTS